MPDFPVAIVAVTAIVSIAYGVESVVGFGGSVLAVAGLSFVLPTEEAVAITPILATAASASVFLSDPGPVRFDIVARAIVASLPAAVAGAFLAGSIDGSLLRMAISGAALLSGVRGLGAARTTPLNIPAWVRFPVAGLAIGTSGIGVLYVPPIMLACNSPRSARVTLAVLWLALALVRAPFYFFGGISVNRIATIGITVVPAIVVSVLFGFKLHRRLGDQRYTIVAAVALICVGGLGLYNSVYRLAM